MYRFAAAGAALICILMAITGHAQSGADDRNAVPDKAKSRSGGNSAPAPSQINESQLEGLPLNGRSYNDLATLQGGVSDPGGASGSRGISGGGLTVAGGRPTSNSFLLDGMNIMDMANQTPRSAAGVQLGSDAVLRVQIFSVNYSAEYGRGSGGVLNSITRSGTDQFHGSFFEYFRNSSLDARNFFDAGPEPTPFKRNQFGFVLTGPVRKNNTYFTANFEAMRDRLSQTQVSFFPDEQARKGFPDESGVATVPLHPGVAPYLDLYPIPNGASRGGGIGEHTASVFLPTDENFFAVRVDHRLSAKDSLFARYSFDDASSLSAESSYLFRTLTDSRTQYATLVESHIFNPRLLNTLRLGYTRPVNVRQSLSSIEIPRSLFFAPDTPGFGQIIVPGLSDFGPSPSLPERNFMNSFQFADDLWAQRKAHGLKAGIQIDRYRWDLVAHYQRAGEWSFNSLRSFLQGGPDGTNMQFTLPGSDNTAGYRETLVGLFLQDDYRPTPPLQLNLGLRYEFTTTIHEEHGKGVFMTDLRRDTSLTIGPILGKNPTLRNLSPRVGIAWSPGHSRTTVVRAGFGIYYDPIFAYVIQARKSTAPFFNRIVKVNFDSRELFPDVSRAALAAPTVPPQAMLMDYWNTTTPMVLRYSLTLDRQFPGGWGAQMSYIGARGNHLFRSYEANQFPAPDIGPDGSPFFPPNSGRVNPSFGSINLMTSDAQSFYNAFQLSANRSSGRSFSFQASYTYSKSVDDASSPMSFGSAQSQYDFMRTVDRALSDFDIRHRFSLNYFYTLPGAGTFAKRFGFLSGVLGNWRVAGILSFRTGTPFTPQINVRTPGYLFAANRPDLMPGRSNNPVQGLTQGCAGIQAGTRLGTPDLYFDPCAYSVPLPGRLGNVGRNTLIAPEVFTLDVSLQKEFLLGKERRLQFRSEFFNLPNHANFSGPGGGGAFVFTGQFPGQINPSGGRISKTITTARQIQFALKLTF